MRGAENHAVLIARALEAAELASNLSLPYWRRRSFTEGGRAGGSHVVQGELARRAGEGRRHPVGVEREHEHVRVEVQLAGARDSLWELDGADERPSARRAEFTPERLRRRYAVREGLPFSLRGGREARVEDVHNARLQAADRRGCGAETWRGGSCTGRENRDVSRSSCRS